MKKIVIFPFALTMFGEGAAPAGGSTTGTAPAGTEGGNSGTPASTQQAKTGETVLYGKQPAEDNGGDKTPKGTKEPDSRDAGGKERNAKYKELITGEYKDLYDQDVNRIIGKRFKDAKATQESLDAQKPIISMLAQKYGVKDGDVQALSAAIESDNAMWEAQAENAGMSVEQYKQVQKLQLENEQLRQAQINSQREQRVQKQTQEWIQQAEELKANPQFKDFDLAAEIENSPDFLNMLKAGISVGHAYSVVHMDDMLGAAATAATEQTKKAVVSNIRARGARPVENGVSPKSGVVIKPDPKNWSKEDFRNVWKKVARGEEIKL